MLRRCAGNACGILWQCSGNTEAMLRRCLGDAQAMLGRYSSDALIGTIGIIWSFQELQVFYLSLWGALGLESISSLVITTFLCGLYQKGLQNLLLRVRLL